MSRQNTIYKFGEFELDVAEKQLRRRDGEILPLPPKAFDLLTFMVENQGRLLEKNELMDEVWADSFVEEGNLKIHIHRLRKTLNDPGEEFIETIPRRGYRFNARVETLAGGGLVIERVTQGKIVIEQTETDGIKLLPARRARTAWRYLAGLAAVLAIGAIAYLFLFRARPANVLASARLNTMAVMPFNYIGERRPDDEYLREGLPDALITRLSYLQQVKVRPTSATRRYVEGNTDSLTAGRELKVDAVLEGTIRREGDRVRVNVQLVRVADGTTVWSETFNDERSSLISLEETIAARVATSLAVKLDPSSGTQLAQRSTQSEEAYVAYLKGRFFWNKRSGEGYQQAREQYEKAIAADPNFALAYVGRADLGAFAPPKSPTAIQAENDARRAVELNPSLAEPHATLGFIYCFHHWDWPRAEAEFRQSIALNRNYAIAHHWYAIMLSIQKRFAEAESEMRKALEIDPLSLVVNSDLCQIFYFAHRFDEAIAQCRMTLEMDHTFSQARARLQTLFETRNMGPELLAELKEEGVRADSPGMSAIEKGDLRGYHQAVIDFEIKRSDPDYEAVTIAKNYAMIGDKEGSLHWLDRASQTHNFMFPFVNADPAFDTIREDSRFIALMRGSGLSQ